jgi:hypothetical protein
VVNVTQISVTTQNSAILAFPWPTACLRAALTQGINRGSVEERSATTRITTARIGFKIILGSLED